MKTRAFYTLQRCVVISFSSEKPSSTFIGEISRHLLECTAENKRVSIISSQPVTDPPNRKFSDLVFKQIMLLSFSFLMKPIKI